MVEITVNATGVGKALTEYDRDLRRELKVALVGMLADFEGKLKRERFGPYRGRSRSNSLQNRSGNLRNSIRPRRVVETADTFRGGVFTDSVYAQPHEFGATIRPKRKRYLRIPLSDTLTNSGDLRGGLDIKERGGRWETADGDPTFIKRGDRGGLLIFSKDATGGARPLYVLKRQVKIKPRLGFFKTWASLERRRNLRLQQAATTAARGRFDG